MAYCNKVSKNFPKYFLLFALSTFFAFILVFCVVVGEGGQNAYKKVIAHYNIENKKGRPLFIYADIVEYFNHFLEISSMIWKVIAEHFRSGLQSDLHVPFLGGKHHFYNRLSENRFLIWGLFSSAISYVAYNLYWVFVKDLFQGRIHHNQ